MSLIAKFLGPWLYVVIAGALALAVAGIWNAGRNYAQSKCDAARLTLELKRANETIGEQTRQLNEINGIQRRDAERAAVAEQRARELADDIANAPKNDDACLPADAVGRVRRTK
jgi:hypothetical protein